MKPKVHEYKNQKTKTMSKTKEFEVPIEIIAHFANLLIDHNLTNEIVGINGEEETLTIEVSYENKEKGKLLALIEFMDDHYQNENTN